MFLKRKDLIYISIFAYATLILFMIFAEKKIDSLNLCKFNENHACIRFCCDESKNCETKNIHETFNVSNYVSKYASVSKYEHFSVQLKAPDCELDSMSVDSKVELRSVSCNQLNKIHSGILICIN